MVYIYSELSILRDVRFAGSKLIIFNFFNKYSMPRPANVNKLREMDVITRRYDEVISLI